VTDVPRRRKRFIAPAGMGAPIDGPDAVVNARVAELQEGLEELARQIAGIKVQVVEPATGETYDDSLLMRRLNVLEALAEKFRRQIADIYSKLTITAWAKVTGVEDEYLQCVFYSPVSDETGAAINVARPYTDSNYAEDDVIRILKGITGKTDGDANAIYWMAIHDGGVGWATAATKDGLPAPSSATLLARVVGVGDDNGRCYVPNADVDDWICFTHLE